MAIGPIKGITTYYNLNKVNFDFPRWHQYVNDNWDTIDAAIHGIQAFLDNVNNRIDDALEAADNAEASAGAAATSESNAAASAGAAATSEGNAATSAANAATSESNAATSESNAADSAETAEEQADIAVASASTLSNAVDQLNALWSHPYTEYRVIPSNIYADGSRFVTDEEDYIVGKTPSDRIDDLSLRPYIEYRSLPSLIYTPGATVSTDEDDYILGITGLAAETASALYEDKNINIMRKAYAAAMDAAAQVIAGPPVDEAGVDTELAGSLGLGVDFITNPATIAGLPELVNICIPEIESTWFDRVFLSYYGDPKAEGSMSPENAVDADMMSWLFICDDFKNGNIPADGATLNLNPVAVYRGSNGNEDAYIPDNQLFRMPHKNQMGWWQNMRNPSGRVLTGRTRLLLNPDEADPANFVWGPDTKGGRQFAMRPAYDLGGDIRFWTENKNQNVIFNRLITDGNRFWGQPLTQITSAILPGDVAEDYWEPSSVYCGNGVWLTDFRVNIGHMTTISTNDGLIDWSSPAVRAWFETHPASTASKADMSRLPSGRILWAGNASSLRMNMAVCFSKPYDKEIPTWGATYIVDARGRGQPGGGSRGPFVTYPRVMPIFNKGIYTGWFLLAFDRGRADSFAADGSAVAYGTPGSICYNEIVVLAIKEEEAVLGDFSNMRRYTINPAPLTSPF